MTPPSSREETKMDDCPKCGGGPNCYHLKATTAERWDSQIGYIWQAGCICRDDSLPEGVPPPCEFCRVNPRILQVLDMVEAASRRRAIEECVKIAKTVPHLPEMHDKQIADCGCPSDEGGTVDEWCQKAVDAVCCMREQIADALRNLSPAPSIQTPTEFPMTTDKLVEPREKYDCTFCDGDGVEQGATCPICNGSGSQPTPHGEKETSDD